MTNDPSAHRTAPSSPDADRLHDEHTETVDGAVGADVDGNIHVGYWDSAADDRSLNQATDRLTDLVAERLAAAPGHRLLDVGCGTGRPALRIARATGAQVSGVSVSDQDIELARTRAEAAALADRVDFRYADARALPFAAESFDGAWAIESMMHIGDRTAALTEIARTLRPGSPLVITDVLVRSPVTGEAAEIVRRTSRAFQSPALPEPEELRTALDRAGLEVVEFTDIGEHVRRTYQAFADAFADVAPSADDPHYEFFNSTRSLPLFGALPQVGYVFLVARRP
ncbi:SAM-dependent methyltransferase [Streptomyces clavuligerus]|uniref:Methyltransferase n=1 Tax=Streptomyces clavuligerus TaxID=1901 RepID=B5GZG7_STRCL|nr:methyltransferase domain-containing protein [Streptomyces clavuligerus]ANW17646.1 methyltransferase [Streptomyces clavuligerus]AXU12197.1 class I SAM-dependent methyltransferase [Streptomyces clavuligerus]EDY51713.1 methyltransferase [Streptomyces clavuligerus]EFG09834.1 Methyltransferase [Streptomyces clavuligerus]MBY6302065.1 methyltransferase domain-containing protein [Streptomyces clavuligerus]